MTNPEVPVTSQKIKLGKCQVISGEWDTDMMAIFKVKTQQKLVGRSVANEIESRLNSTLTDKQRVAELEAEVLALKIERAEVSVCFWKEQCEKPSGSEFDQQEFTKAVNALNALAHNNKGE